MLLILHARRPGEDSDAESSRGTSRTGGSSCETQKRAGGAVEGKWLPHNMIKLNSQRLSRLTLRNRFPMTSLNYEVEVCNSIGLLEFEYFEQILKFDVEKNHSDESLTKTFTFYS